MTNDKERPGLSVSLIGYVEQFAQITPTRVGFSGSPQKAMPTKVNIVPNEKYPFKIIATESRPGQNIRFNLEEAIATGGQGYILTVENTRSENGRYFETVVLKTDNPLKPEINVIVTGNLSEPAAAQ